jgi:hypothetical protein
VKVGGGKVDFFLLLLPHWAYRPSLSQETVTKAESGVVKSESLLGLKPAYAKPRLRCMRAANSL